MSASLIASHIAVVKAWIAFGPVEPDATDTAFDTDQDVIGHWRSMSRLTITRMIWLVPSRIEWTRRSRQKRSIG